MNGMVRILTEDSHHLFSIFLLLLIVNRFISCENLRIQRIFQGREIVEKLGFMRNEGMKKLS